MIPFNRSSCDVISGWLTNVKRHSCYITMTRLELTPIFVFYFTLSRCSWPHRVFFFLFFFFLLSFTVLALCFLPGIPCRYSKLFGGFVCQKTMIAFLIPAFYIRHAVHVGVTYRVFVKHINKQHKNVLWKLLGSAC